jgi:hypothetical protein
MAPMKRERCRFSVTVFGKSLFAFGGVSESSALQTEQDDGDLGDDEDGDDDNNENYSASER